LRPLGISTLKRDPTLPDVPTISEAGVPDYEMGDWIGIVAPKNTPQAVINKMNKAIGEALAVPEVRTKIEMIGTQVDAGTPEQLAAHIKSEIAKWNKVITAMDIKLK
jgi:tripartite-type tricarboxylate transporter receptor subunit TctC